MLNLAVKSVQVAQVAPFGRSNNERQDIAMFADAIFTRPCPSSPGALYVAEASVVSISSASRFEYNEALGGAGGDWIFGLHLIPSPRGGFIW